MGSKKEDKKEDKKRIKKKDKKDKKFKLGDKLNLREILIFIRKFFVFLVILFVLFSFISPEYYAFVFELSKPVVGFFSEHFHPTKENLVDFSSLESFANIVPFIALVLATPKILLKRKIKIIFIGFIILLLLQVIFMVSTILMVIEIEEKKYEMDQELDKELDVLWADLSAETDRKTMEEIERLKTEGKTNREIDEIIEKLKNHECEKVADEKIRTLCTELMNDYEEKEKEIRNEKEIKAKKIKPSWFTKTVSSFLGGMGMIIFPFILWIALCYSYLAPWKVKENPGEKFERKRKFKKKG